MLRNPEIEADAIDNLTAFGERQREGGYDMAAFIAAERGHPEKITADDADEAIKRLAPKPYNPEDTNLRAESNKARDMKLSDVAATVYDPDEAQHLAYMWNYYQTLLRHHGADGFTDLLVQRDQARKELKTIKDGPPIWQRNIDQFFRDALVAMAGAVCTPEKGYKEDGGLSQLLADIKTLRAQHDQYKASFHALDQN